MRTFLIVLVAIIAFFFWLPTPDAPPVEFAAAQEGNGFVLRDVRVFDGERFHERRDIVVQDGMIMAFSPRTPAPEGLPEYDGSGHTLMPALFDAHTHNFGTARSDALRFGVGTQIDMFTNVSSLADARDARESVERTEQADLWSAGTLVTAAGGHGTQFGMAIPTLDDAADAERFIAARIAEGSDFIKLVLEPGHIIGRPLPTFDAATLNAAIAAAHARGKLAVVHATTQADAVIAVHAGADGLVHIFGDSVIDAALVDAMVERGTFVIPTLSILESISGTASGLEQDARIAPYLTSMQRDSLARPFPGASSTARSLENALESVRRLHAAGVPVLGGSDAPNPGTAHGASMHRELELLVAAGMTPTEALAAATSVVARHFDIGDRGRIARDLRADLVLLAGDPSTDITATRGIVAIWKNGFRVARERFDGPGIALPTLDEPDVGMFDAGTDDWQVTTDGIQGGTSEAAQRVESGALVVSGEVKTGPMFAWAGTIKMFGTSPFAPVDASAYSTLELRIRGDGGPLTVMLFSGEAAQAPPAIHSIDVGTEWTTVSIPLNEITGLNLGMLRALAVVAGPDARTFSFALDSVVLR